MWSPVCVAQKHVQVQQWVNIAMPPSSGHSSKTGPPFLLIFCTHHLIRDGYMLTKFQGEIPTLSHETSHTNESRWRPQMMLALAGKDGVLNAGGAHDLISPSGPYLSTDKPE